MNNVNNILKDYDRIEDTIKKIYSSDLRMRVFLSLDKNPRRIRDICEVVCCKPQNASTRLKELQEMVLVEDTEGGYVLTVWGDIIKRKTIELNIGRIGNILEDYEKTESIIRKIYSSCMRTKIFLLLNKKPKHLRDIYPIVCCKPQNTLAVIKELQEMLLVESTEGGYVLTV